MLLKSDWLRLHWRRRLECIAMTLRADRIQELLTPFLAGETLFRSQIEGLQTYLDLLLKWNAKINLTSVRDPEEVVVRHFGESLFAARHLFLESSPISVIDVGSGAGFPGIPIKIWNESIEIVLVDSNVKKSAFLREVTRALNLKGVTVESKRAEGLFATADLVTLRAVERFNQILPTAHRLLRSAGRLALLIGEAQIEVAKTVLPDLNWADAIKIPVSNNRVLLVGNS